MPRACDTAALCQGQTSTCWYVSAVTFLWKTRGALAQCDITLPRDIEAFVQSVAETCARGVQCLNLPGDTLRAYMDLRASRQNRGDKPTLYSGGDASLLLAALLKTAGVATDVFNNPTRALSGLVGTFRATRVFVVSRPPTHLGVPNASPVDRLSGPRMLIGMLAEARACPKSVTLLGAFVSTRNTVTGRNHVFTIVRCGTHNTFMICDSATAQCWDGASEQPFEFGSIGNRTFRRVSFVYGRLASFVDAAARV
jgi:hypothetical protein